MSGCPCLNTERRNKVNRKSEAVVHGAKYHYLGYDSFRRTFLVNVREECTLKCLWRRQYVRLIGRYYLRDKWSLLIKVLASVTKVFGLCETTAIYYGSVDDYANCCDVGHTQPINKCSLWNKSSLPSLSKSSGYRTIIVHVTGFFRNGAGLAAQTTTVGWEPNFADATIVEASHL